MKFKLEMEMDNAAFSEGMNGYEAARILRQVADRIEEMHLTPRVEDSFMDINGNPVGSWKVTR